MKRYTSFIKRDIYYSDWDSLNNEWSKAKLLNEINTPGNEACPFIEADNLTLIFSSDSYSPNYGGLDLYITRYDPQTQLWSKPENLGKPINTKYDDMFATMPESGDVIYFSSDRKDIQGSQGGYDLYIAILPKSIFAK